MFLIIIGVIIAIVLIISFELKRLKLDCVVLIDGGVKVGKSTLAFYLARKEYKKAHRKWFFKHFFQRDLEEPLFYSNIPTTCEYVPLTREMLERKVRICEKSVTYIDEMSLVADSMSYKDDLMNERISLFFKLYGHECGGKCIVNTHCIADNHFGLKRAISRHLYVYHCTKWIPFILIFKVREMFYSDDGSIINTSNTDIEESMKTYVCSKRVWKQFDYRAFSVFTDSLPTTCDILPRNNKRSLKVDRFVSFKNYKTLILQDKNESEVNTDEN